MSRRRVALIFGLLFVILAAGFLALRPNGQKGQETIFPPARENPSVGGEEQRIEAWIEQNDLNQYGDPKDTVYLGGTPLFDERTGQSIDRYKYILQKHPDKPWQK